MARTETVLLSILVRAKIDCNAACLHRQRAKTVRNGRPFAPFVAPIAAVTLQFRAYDPGFFIESKMNPLLFRARARQVSRRNATFGGLTSDPISTAARVMIASALTLVLTGLLGFVPLPDRVLLSGYLYEPKTLVQTAATSGQIQAIAVQVGDIVEPGKVIAYITPLPPSPQADSALDLSFEARARQREYQINQQQQTLLVGKIRGEISLLTQQQHWRQTLINLETEHLKQQQKALRAARDLFQSRFISAIEWQRMQAPLRTLATRVVHLRSERADLAFKLASARANLKSAKLDGQRAEVQAQRQRHNRSRQEKQWRTALRRTIAATSPGRVVRRAAEPGDFVTHNTPIIELATTKPYYLAKLRVPKAIQTALSVGDPLDLKLLTHLTPMDGSISGTIRDLSPISVSDPPRSTQSPTDLIATVSLPKPIITSTGQRLHFTAGTQAQTWLIVSEKTLIERFAAMIAPELGAHLGPR